MMKWILAAMIAACAGPPAPEPDDEQTETPYETLTEQAAPDDWIGAPTDAPAPILAAPYREPATKPDPIDYCWPDQVDVTRAPNVTRVIAPRATQTMIDDHRWRDLQRRST